MTAETKAKTEWSIKRLLAWTGEYLTKAEVDQPRLCAEIMLAHVLGCERLDLYLRFNECPGSEQLTAFRALVRRCLAGEPVAYLTGRAYFYGLQFRVTPAVLVPRAETETLVTEALDCIRRQTSLSIIHVLDLCTGSGCVASAIAVNAVEAAVVATDSSAGALDIARENVKAHDLEGRVSLLQSDLFDQIGGCSVQIFDLIVSNPPYVSAGEFEKLAVGIREYEPREALLAGEDGLDFHRRIVNEAEPYLAPGASLLVEVGDGQAESVVVLFEQSGYLDQITVVKDDLGHGRVVKAMRT